MFRAVILTLLLPAMVATAAETRQELDLNGAWQYQLVSELDTPPTAGTWQAIEVPATIFGYDYEKAWFRRTFTLPESMRGKRIKIRFDGVKYNSRVYVNGQYVGGCFNGYDVFEVDVTHAIRFGQSNRLAVGCHDWTGVFSEGHFDFSTKPDWQRPRRYVTDKVIAPIGGHYDQYGIWGDVVLLAHPAVYVEDLFIKPSVRQHKLVVEYTVTNESDTPVEVVLEGTVEDQGGDVWSFASHELSVPAGGKVDCILEKSWPEAHYWSHEDPYLYHLRSELSSGDVLRTRFGFREFWIEGHRYVLNGSKVNLLGTSWWPPTLPITRDEIEQQWRALRAAGINCFRTHTQPWRRMFYDVADEVGLLMIVEGAVWHDPYCTCYDDPRFWDNYGQMIRAMLYREKNRPSVIMWSMGNELYSGGGKMELAVKGLAKTGRLAKEWDPTRPIYFESDGDPEGVADAIGMHYVHEYPKYTCWPNEAYWLDKPFTPNTWHGMVDGPIEWQKEKPLYLGEFLWVPSGSPAPHTIFYGDEAYRDLDQYTRKGKGEAWKMQVLAFRHQEVGGMCPWTVGTDLNESNPLYRAHQLAYQPVAAYCLDYDRRFYSGERVARRVDLFNDTLSDAPLHFSWVLSSDGQELARHSQVVQLAPGTRRMLTVELPMPQVKVRSPLAWQLMIERDGVQIFEQTHDYGVFPDLQLSTPTARIGLFDPRGATAALFSQQNVAYTVIDDLKNIASDCDLLVLGSGSLQVSDPSGSKTAVPVIGRIDPQRGAMLDFVAQGGRLLVLRQDAYPEGLFDLEPTQQQSTMTYPTRPGHPVLAGLQAEDLRFWRGDNMVTRRELPRPANGAMIPIVVSGSDTGIAHAPLLERPLGLGCFMHCQMQLVEKARNEPAAGVLLQNLLNYLGSYQVIPRRTAVWGADPTYCETLREMGLRFDDLQAGDNLDLSPYSLVILRGLADGASLSATKLAAFVKRGGNLLVHRPSAAVMDQVGTALNTDLVLQPYEGSVSRADGRDPLLNMVTREDLYWSVKQDGLSWARQPLAQDMVDGLLGPPFDATDAESHEIELWRLSGEYVHQQSPGVLFATVGTAVGQIDFPESGKFGIGIRARGTPSNGVYPIARVSVDGKPFGLISIQDGPWQDYGVFGHVDKGQHEVTVAFINDGSDPPKEDRNLEVDKVFVVRESKQDDSLFLVAPPAVVAQRHGDGIVIFDRLRWDTESANSRKAIRYACSLLTALQGDFRPKSAVTLECEQMTPQDDLPHYSEDGSTAYMGSNGYLQSEIEVSEAKTYLAELVAGGDDSEGICPLVELRLNGRKIAEVQLTTESWRAYRFPVELPQGQHTLTIWFMNDHYAPSGDRNLRLDKLVIYNEDPNGR